MAGWCQPVRSKSPVSLLPPADIQSLDHVAMSYFDRRLLDATHAMHEILKVIEEGRDMVTAGAVGVVLDDTLRHARELLDIVDEALADLDRAEHADVLDSARVMRHKLERLHEELRGNRLQ